jgi:hypothetical protein
MLGILIESQEANVRLEVSGVAAEGGAGVTLKSVFILADHQQPLDITRYLCPDHIETLEEELNWGFARNPNVASTTLSLDYDPLPVTINGDYSEEEDGVTSVLLGELAGEHVDIYFYCRSQDLAVWEQMLADRKAYDDEMAHGDDDDDERS